MTSFPDRTWVESAATALSADLQFSRMSHAFSATVRLDFGEAAYALTVDEGDVAVRDGDPEFVAWDFAVRAPEATWEAMLSETPPPPYHDLLGAWLQGDVTIEGDLRTAMQHLRPLKRTIVIFRAVANE